ncbi:MAG: hypothetical protein K8953_02540, partial [Proteobacteria bacterium]|nr:hypothetical protein [Pseudomonadota bacterium]
MAFFPKNGRFFLYKTLKLCKYPKNGVNRQTGYTLGCQWYYEEGTLPMATFIPTINKQLISARLAV